MSESGKQKSALHGIQSRECLLWSINCFFLQGSANKYLTSSFMCHCERRGTFAYRYLTYEGYERLSPETLFQAKWDTGKTRN